MKRLVFGFIAITIIALAMPVHAQGIYTGIAGGLNFADLEISFNDPTMTNYETKSRTLFGVGAILGISVNEFLSVQLEPMYVAKGGIYTERTMPEMKIKSSHIDLPLLATLGIGDEVRPFIAVGPFVSFLLDASLSAELAGRVWEGDLLQALKRTEFGVMFGAGLGIPLWNGSVLIEGRYSLGLTNCNKGGSFDLKSGNLIAGRISTDPRNEIKTRGILVMIGYQIPLDGE